MTTRRTDKKCDKAVVGEKLREGPHLGAVQPAPARQLPRRLGEDHRHRGSRQPQDVGGSVQGRLGEHGKEREEYIKPLPGKDKVTKLLGTGEAFVGEWRHGHYVVMVWFQYKDGHMPKKTEVKKLNQAAFGAADATVTPALESRTLTGKRP